MEWTWLFLIIIFLVIEGLSFNLVTIWLAVGALAAFISAYFISDFLIQMLIFVFVSAGSLILTRPIVKKYLAVKPVRTNLDAVIGEIGIVTEAITKDKLGKVKVNGKLWTAKSKESLKSGSKVEILDIEGVKLIVTKEEK